jgi:hypothetical protein
MVLTNLPPVCPILFAVKVVATKRTPPETTRKKRAGLQTGDFLQLFSNRSAQLGSA